MSFHKGETFATMKGYGACIVLGEGRRGDWMGLEGKGGDLKSQAAFLEFLVSAQEPPGKYRGYGLTQ